MDLQELSNQELVAECRMLHSLTASDNGFTPLQELSIMNMHMETLIEIASRMQDGRIS